MLLFVLCWGGGSATLVQYTERNYPSHVVMGLLCAREEEGALGMCLDSAGLDIPFDPVVKDWSVERPHWDERCKDCRGAGERRWLGGEGWGYTSNYLARNRRKGAGQLKGVGGGHASTDAIIISRKKEASEYRVKGEMIKLRIFFLDRCFKMTGQASMRCFRLMDFCTQVAATLVLYCRTPTQH